MLSEDQVKHIAKLAKLSLNEKEVKKFSGQLSDILDYIDTLSEVDTEGVEPTSQVTGLTNVTEGDDEVNCPHSKKLLDCSSLPKVRGQIRVHSSFT
jgi:aspartyl-tRNA(Asn)/glutamyl-tRNA(Gln) amidotransferase subunit C